MRKSILLSLFMLLLPFAFAGCHTEPASKPADSPPCKPSVSEEMHPSRHPAAIKTKAEDHKSSWSELHEVGCGPNESFVLPSERMFTWAYEHYKNDDADKWIAEHTFCQPDGFTTPNQRTRSK